MAQKQIRIRVYETDESTTDFDITNSQLIEFPTIPSNRAHMLEGKLESVSFNVKAGDFSGYVSTQLSDSDARQHLQGRFVDVSVDTGGGFNIIWSGRWVGASEMNGPGEYNIHLSDEHWKGRNADLFRTQDTCQIWPNFPHGIKDDWGPEFYTIQAADPSRGVVRATQGSYAQLWITGGLHSIPEGVAALIVDDLVEDAHFEPSRTSGNFQTLRAETAPYDTTSFTEREIIGFSSSEPSNVVADTTGSIIGTLNDEEPSWPTIVWLDFAGPPPSVGTALEIFFHMDGHETTEYLPFHIGGTTGVDPISYIKGIYDDVGMRYDGNVFDTYDASTNPNGLIAHPKIPKMFFRIEEPKKVGPWTQKIYKTLGLVPFLNNNGEISPRFAFLAQDEDPNTYTVVDPSNVSTDGHPTWEHRGNEAITEVSASYTRYVTSSVFSTRVSGDGEETGAIDRVEKEERTLNPIQHDRISAVGSRVHELDLTPFFRPRTRFNFHEYIAQEILDRFGDGPLRGEFKGLSTLESIERGDFVVIDLDTFPNANATGGRGGSRVVQIIGKSFTPAGPDFVYLDAGPDEQALSLPTITIAKNTTYPTEAVDVSLSGIDADAVRWQLQLRVDSGDWVPYYENVVGTTSTTIYGLPAGNLIEARALVTAPERIRSDWSVVDSVTLDGYTAPSALSTSVDGTSITLSWTNGQSDLPVMPVILEGTSGTPIDALRNPLPPGTTEYTFSELKASTQYTVGVYHDNPTTGGKSTQTTTTATTGAENTLSEPRRLVILQGRTSSQTLPEEDLSIGEGLQIGFQPTETFANTEIQVATDSGFTNVVSETSVSAGVTVANLLGLDLATTYYVRIRHAFGGYTDSGWSSTVSAQATRVISGEPNEDNFAAGSARLYVDSGVLKVFIDSNDRDTDRVYYEAVKNPGSNPYPTVTTADNEVTRANLPYDNDALDAGGSQITMAAGDEAYVTVRFYNDVTGFGAAVQDTILVPDTFTPGPDGSVSPIFQTDGDLTAIAVGNGQVSSWKIAGAIGSPPSDATIRAETAINGQSLDEATIGILDTGATPGQTGYVAAFAYDQTGGGGTESARIEAAVLFGVDGGVAIVADTVTANEIASLLFTGKQAEFDTGTVGGWTMDSGQLYAGTPGTDGIDIRSDVEQIRVGAAVSATSGIGAFLGMDGGTAQFRAGDPNNDYIHWDGLNLSVTGSITADSGDIGGWDITASALQSPSASVAIDASNEQIRFNTSGPLTGVGIWMGNDGGDWEFRAGDPNNDYIHWNGTSLSVTGSITADSGDIGGWTIGASSISNGSTHLESTNERIRFSATGFDPSTGGAGVIIGADGADYEIRAGDSTNYLWWDGTNLTLRGGIIESPGVGSDISLLGWTHDMTFSATDEDTVAWTSGTIELQNGQTYSITANNTGNMAAVTYIYLDTGASTTALAISTAATDSVGVNKILVAVAGPSGETDKDAEFQVFGGQGGLSKLFTADNIATNTLTANEVAANTLTGNEIESRAISTRHLFVGSFDNLIPNPGFEQSTTISDTHEVVNNGGGSFNIATDFGRGGGNSLRYDQSGQTATARYDLSTDFSSLDANQSATEGDQFYAEGYVLLGSGTPNGATLNIRFRDETGAGLGGNSSGAATATGSWQKMSVSSTAPSGTAYVVLSVQVNNDGNTGVLRFDDLYMRRKVSGSVVVDGTITGTNINATFNITGKNITADTGTIGGWSLSGSTLSSGDMVLDATNERIRIGATGFDPSTGGTGVIMGDDGSGNYDFRAGDSSNYIWWDDSANSLTVVGTITVGSGSDVPWGTVSGSNKPEDGAQVNAASTLSLEMNRGLDGTSNAHEAILTGFSDGSPDRSVQGYIYWDGSRINIPRDGGGGDSNFTILTTDSDTSSRGFIVVDTALSDPFTVGGFGVSVVFVRHNGSNWQYDNNGGWTNFTPTDNYVAVGWLEKGGSGIARGGLFQPTTLELAAFPAADPTSDNPQNLSWLITSGLISAGSMDIDADNEQIRIGATGFDPSTGGAGVILGRESAGNYDFRIGDSTSYLWWDHSANSLTFTGSLSAVDGDFEGSINVGTTNQIWMNDGGDGSLQIGGSTKASAPFRVTAAGALTATSASITGTIEAGSTVATGDLSASAITAAGTITVEANSGGDSLIELIAFTGGRGAIYLRDETDTRSANWYVGASEVNFESTNGMDLGIYSAGDLTLSAGGSGDIHLDATNSHIRITSFTATAIPTGSPRWLELYVNGTLYNVEIREPT